MNTYSKNKEYSILPNTGKYFG